MRKSLIMERLRRLGELKWISPILITLFLSVLPMDIHAMTAQEILEQVTKQSFSDNFRVAATVKAFIGHTLISNHALWLIVKVDQGKSSFFLDSDEPKTFRGLRFLFLEEAEQEGSAYMYLPATGKTMPLAVDASVGVGGTRLTAEDLQAFIGKREAGETVLKEEPGAASWKVRRVAWIAERKNLLSALFYLSSLMTFIKYCRTGRSVLFPAVLLLFMCGLLSKPAVPFPRCANR